MSDYTIIRSDDYLAHHGIKGQKWGIRRFENEDGTLTAEGYERYYGKRFEKESRKQQRLNYKADQDKQVRLAKDHVSKAKKNLVTGLAGAASAAAGYGLIKAHGSDALSVQRISGYDASTGNRFSYIQDAHKLILPTVGLLGVAIGGPTAVVGLGKAAYHGIRASVANHRASIVGHQKAAQKAKTHLEGMKEMFENTPYAALIDERFG